MLDQQDLEQENTEDLSWVPRGLRKLCGDEYDSYIHLRCWVPRPAKDGPRWTKDYEMVGPEGGYFSLSDAAARIQQYWWSHDVPPTHGIKLLVYRDCESSSGQMWRLPLLQAPPKPAGIDRHEHDGYINYGDGAIGTVANFFERHPKESKQFFSALGVLAQAGAGWIQQQSLSVKQRRERRELLEEQMADGGYTLPAGQPIILVREPDGSLRVAQQHQVKGLIGNE